MKIHINHNGKTAEEIYGIAKEEITASLLLFHEKIKVADYDYDEYDKFVLIVALISVLRPSAYIAIISILGKSERMDLMPIPSIVELLIENADEFIKRMAPAFQLYIQMKEKSYVNPSL